MEIKKYDFNCPDRLGTYSYKWNGEKNELPMWVADMDFETAPEIKAALRARVEHGVFGYTEVPDAWYNAYINWWRSRHGFTIEREWLMFSTGVVASISSIVRRLVRPNEKVLLLTPTYNIFFNSIVNNGAFALQCPLKYDGVRYEIDFCDLEKKLADPQTRMMILCNPHNPVGCLWSADTLAQIGSLAARYGVTVLSDEIHCDIVRPGCEYVPFASVNEECRNNSITCIAPTKTFNIAGLQTSAVFVPNALLRHQVYRAINNDEIAEPNVFAVTAPIAAFNECGAWLQQLNELLWTNRERAQAFLTKNAPALSCVSADATYLLWIDARALKKDSASLVRFLRERVGLQLSSGAVYGEGGDGFLRLNLATSPERLQDGLERLARGVALLLKE